MGDCYSALENWEAWHDFMPGSPPTLHVHGTLKCPTSGYELSLRRSTPQGTNPRDLRLDLIEVKPTGGALDKIWPTWVHYREDTEEHFDTVSIQPDGPVGIPVKILEKSNPGGSP